MSPSSRVFIVVVVLLAACTWFVTDAQAACFSKVPALRSGLPLAAPSSARASTNNDDDDDWDSDRGESIVGLWDTKFFFGPASGGVVIDRTFQQFHSDRTELMISNGLHPSFGNVCVGVWKLVGRRTIKLRHVTWNWNAPPATGPFDVSGFGGTFVMEVTLRVNRGRETFSGTWSSISYADADATVPIPGSEASGDVQGTRITVAD
jgi:hypothetical protein